ncbi:MAG: ABC transporter permease [Vicinamibacterales bacterium]
MASLVRNLKLALRVAVRQPLFSLTVVLTLALAIGANAVIFGMVEMLLLRPLPIAEPERVGYIFGVDESRGFDRADIPPADYLDFQAIRSFTHVAAFTRSTHTLTGRGNARRLSALQITPSAFDVWGIQVVHGRRFHAADGVFGAVPVVLLTETFWRREFAADPAAVGQSVTLSGTPHTIVGILGPELNYGGLAAIDVWVPYAADRPDASRADRRLAVMGLFAPGAGVIAADAEIKALADRIASQHPVTHASWSARVVPVREGIAGENDKLILALLVITVTMVFLIACANVTNMLLASMAGRGREFAVRSALGAGRGQVIGQLLSEAFVLAAAGGLLGLAFSYAAIKLLASLAQGNFFFDTLAVNYRIALFVMLLSFVAPVLFALIPALQSTRTQASGGLNDLGARIAGTPRARRLRGALVVAQIALAMTLMVVSTLALRSLIAVMTVDLGFNDARIAVVRFEAPPWKYASDDDVRRLVAASLDRLRAAPGVTLATAASSVPGIDADVMGELDIEGRPADRGVSRLAGRVLAGDQYFDTLGIPILAGRPIDARDSLDARPVSVVSRTAAERYLGGVESAVGQRVRLGAAAAFTTVVGVAADVANSDVDQDPNPIVYLPFAQQPWRDIVVLAASPAPAAVTSGLRDAMHAVDRDVAVDVATFGGLLRQEFSALPGLAALFVAFGGVALALAASGLYGVIAFVVAQRTREFGVRVALGARPSDLRSLLVRQGGVLIGTGLVLGLAGSIALAQVTRGVLFGVSVSDPTTYLAIALIVAVTALVATYVPARRAMRVDPIEALRAE